MTKIDQFESAFRAAARDTYVHEGVGVGCVLVVTDLEGQAAAAYQDGLREALQRLPALTEDTTWELLAVESVDEVLATAAELEPDLICTYRNVGMTSWQQPTTLGPVVDVLTQATPSPVLLLPHPRSEAGGEGSGVGRVGAVKTVAAVTDHLSGESSLVNHAVAFTPPGGHLFLCHLEDDAYFDYVMGAIAKLPFVDTDEVRTGLRTQLLKDPHEYVKTCKQVLVDAGLDVNVDEVVGFGHLLTEYVRLLGEHSVDLLVMNTKDDDQLAMHGLAYPLAIELRELPLLLL